jgi:hypothetical protein
MLATINSGTRLRKTGVRLHRFPALFYACLFACYWLMASSFCSSIQAADRAEFARRAEKTYLAEQQRWEADKTNPTNAWQFARACFDWADFATNKTTRAEIATIGIEAARAATAFSPTLAPAHYYLALNLGQLAQTKSLGALRLVAEMEEELKRSSALDSKFDFAGADRTLGLLYLDAPSWPMSVGSNSKGRAHLVRAVELFPDFPDNRISLVESLLKLGDKNLLPAELQKLEKLLPSARTNLTGETWELSWSDWDKRWQAIQIKTGKTK